MWRCALSLSQFSHFFALFGGQVATISNVMNDSACCDLCKAHNAARPSGAPDSTNCTIAVWHGPGHWKCSLKATANSPFNSSLVSRSMILSSTRYHSRDSIFFSQVAAYQPVPMPPVVPIRFASIYTNHTVLQSAPARAMVWGFANIEPGETISVVRILILV